jgi:AAHS family 4-hydroxybenzoate transporter-like MFS transporter
MSAAEKLNITDLIDNSRIGRFQIGVFALCAMSLLMDGFVVQAMGYVAPEVIGELGMSDPQLGNVLAAANFGLLIGGQPGLNALAATYYPTSMRTTGIGWGLGIGRFGAIVGPYVGGRLLDLTIGQLFLVFAGPAVISMLVMLSLHFIMKPQTRTR